jgi:hypothetical protein
LKEEIVSFLDTKIKDLKIDPDKNGLPLGMTICGE